MSSYNWKEYNLCNWGNSLIYFCFVDKLSASYGIECSLTMTDILHTTYFNLKEMTKVTVF